MGRGGPKKARFDIEPAMVGIESSEAVGSHPEPVGLQEVPVESANSAVVGRRKPRFLTKLVVLEGFLY